MKESDLSAGFSWKRGFLTNKLKGNINTQAPPQVKVKRISEIQCPLVEKTQNKFQRNSPTGKAVPARTDLAMATDPASSSLLNVTIDTAPTIGTGQRLYKHDSTGFHKVCLGTVPHTAVQHDDGHIHRASPVRGLPPETQQIKDTVDTKHNDHEWTSTATKEALQITKSQGLRQENGEMGNTTTAQLLARDATPLSVDPSPQNSAPPQDAKDSPESAISAIAALRDHQDPLQTAQALQQTHSPDDEDWYLTPSSKGERQLEKSDDSQRQYPITHHELPGGVQCLDQRAKRTRSTWKQGFLAAHKPPTHRPTLQSTQHRSNPLVNNGQTNTSRASSAVGISTSTMAQHSAQISFMQRYDLRLNLRSPDGAILSEWEGATNLLLRLQALDETIEVWPWELKDHPHNRPIAITGISHAFFDLHIYVPGLASTKVSLRSRLELGDTRHPFLFLRSSVEPTQLVDQLGPWLRATGQDMWVRQLPLAEQTKCIGWLLYSAPEYNLDSLHRQIKQDTGLEVELRFCHIVDEGASRADSTIPQTKAIHLEVDQGTPHSQLKSIERVYSANARRFPLGIKMRLVPPRGTGTSTDHDIKVGKLIKLQARFLKYTETRWIGEESSVSLPQHCQLYDTLRTLTTPLMANRVSKPLFHAISSSSTNNGYTVRYLPQYRAPALAAIARLTNQNMPTPVPLDRPLAISKAQYIPVTRALPRATGPLEALEQWIQARFITPFRSCSQPSPHITNHSTQSIIFRSPHPSHYKLLPWLAALEQKFQNTAWDKWRYRNGVL